MGIWVMEEDCDKAVRDHMRNVARETIGLKLMLSVRFVLK
jgi:hypothetical protein